MQIYCYQDITADSLEDLINRISDIASNVTGFNKDEIISNLKERERISPTTIGKGTLLPHIRLERVENDYLFFFRLKNTLRYKTPDDMDISLVFFIMSPAERKTEYLKLVSSIVKLIKNENLYNKVLSITNSEDLKRLLQENLLSRGIPN